MNRVLLLLFINLVMLSIGISLIMFTFATANQVQQVQQQQGQMIVKQIFQKLSENRNSTLLVVNQTHALTLADTQLLQNLFGNSAKPSLAAQLSQKNNILDHQILDILRNMTHP